MTLPTRIMRALAALAAVAAITALAAGSALAAEEKVSIVGLEFQPPEITVNVGDTITWEVTESIGSPHSVTSGTLGDEKLGDEFDSGPDGLQDVGETFEWTFEHAGTFPYFCTVHGAAMSGEVEVLEAGQSVPPGEQEGPLEETQIPAERRLLAGGVLFVAIVIMFGAAAVWRRMNPA